MYLKQAHCHKPVISIRSLYVCIHVLRQSTHTHAEDPFKKVSLRYAAVAFFIELNIILSGIVTFHIGRKEDYTGTVYTSPTPRASCTCTRSFRAHRCYCIIVMEYDDAHPLWFLNETQPGVHGVLFFIFHKPLFTYPLPQPIFHMMLCDTE